MISLHYQRNDVIQVFLFVSFIDVVRLGLVVNNVSNVNTDYRIRVTDVVEKENIQSSERENRPDNKGNEKNGLIFSEKGIIDVLKTNVLGRGIFV